MVFGQVRVPFYNGSFRSIFGLSSLNSVTNSSSRDVSPYMDTVPIKYFISNVRKSFLKNVLRDEISEEIRYYTACCLLVWFGDTIALKCSKSK